MPFAGYKKYTPLVQKTPLRPFCYLCKGNGRGSALRKCSGCEQWVCSHRECSTWQHNDPWDNTYLGDYPYLICNPCLSHIRPFVREAEEVQEEADRKIEYIQQQWKETCRTALID